MASAGTVDNGTYDLYGDAQLVAASLVAYFVLDTLFKAVGWFPQDKTARYLSLHVLCNGAVTVLSFTDLVLTYSQPAHTTIMADHTDARSVLIILALHVYHILAFRPLDTVDWIHHFVMIALMLPVAYALQPGALLNHGAFFSSGLPGGAYAPYACTEPTLPCLPCLLLPLCNGEPSPAYFALCNGEPSRASAVPLGFSSIVQGSDKALGVGSRPCRIWGWGGWRK